MADNRITAHSSIRSNILNNGGPAPLQGFDVGMWVYDIGRKKNVLAGQFTSTLIHVHIGTEPYMPAGNRQALLLDGEIQSNIEMEKGHLSATVLQETFGFKQFDHKHRYIRSPRFNITFALDPVDWTALDEPGMEFDTFIKRYPAGYMMLTEVKMSDLWIAATAGKSVVANKWRGQSQGILAEVNTLADMMIKHPDRTRAEFDAQGQAIDIDKVRTHHYQGYSDQASTYSPLFEPSRQDDDFFGLLSSALTYSQLLAERNRLMLISYLPGVKEAIQKINDMLQTVFGGDRNATPSFANPLYYDATLNAEGPMSYAENVPADQQNAANWVIAELHKALRELNATNDPGEKRKLQRHYDALRKTLELLSNGGTMSHSVPLDPRGEQLIKSVRGLLPSPPANIDPGPSRAINQDFGQKDKVRIKSATGSNPEEQPPETFSSAE